LGAIMAVGVASANSILLVTFAREQQLAGMSAFDASAVWRSAFGGITRCTSRSRPPQSSIAISSRPFASKRCGPVPTR